jgi:hypothetical protein
MKNMTIIIALLFIFTSCKKESVNPIDSNSNKTSVTQNKSRSFLFVGDSQMAREGSAYTVFTDKYPTETAYKIAKGGMTTEWLADTLEKCDLHYTDVVIFIGTNDTYQIPDINVSKVNIYRIISSVRKNNKKDSIHTNIVFYTVPPCKNFHNGTSYFWDETKGKRINDFNNFLKGLPGVNIVDVYGIVNDNQAIAPIYSEPEGLHINPYANKVIFMFLKAILF